MTANYELNETDSPPTPTSTTCSAAPKHLTEAHRQHLRDSGLTDETIARRGFFSCDDAEGRRILHWSDSVLGNASGLVIPYPNVLGYAKIRTDRPRPLSGEWPAAANEPHQDCGTPFERSEPEPVVPGRKYEAPIGSDPHAYIPLDCPGLSDPERRLYVTEGEKKAELMCQQGQPCIGIPGVSSAHDVRHRRRAQDWDEPEWKLSPEVRKYVTLDREVCTLFDTPDMEENANVIRACVRLTRMIADQGAEPLVGYVPRVTGLKKVGLDDYFVHTMKFAIMDGAPDYNPLVFDFGLARPVGPNAQIEWLEEERAESGWEKHRVHRELRRLATWARVWHERDQKAWTAWSRRASKTFRIEQGEIEKMVAHLGLDRRTGEKQVWSGFGDAAMLEKCIPFLNEGFRLLVDPSGNERVFQVNDRVEATLQQSDANIRKALHDGLKAEFGTVPPDTLLRSAFTLWKKEAPRLPGEPEPFCFAGDDRLCFKRFDWEPTEGPFPAWNEFLSRLSDPEAFMAFVWSCFEKANRSRQYLWLRGEGQDGKSKVLGVLLEVFGPAGAAINNTHVEKGGQFFFSALYGKRLVIYPDCKNSKFGMKEIVRNCTSGDPVPIEFKGETPFTAVLRIKLFVASNPKPEFTGQAADRSRIIYIEVAESPRKDDPTWEERLKAELPGFLWACKAIYERVCPHHGDIPVSEQTKALLDEAIIAFEEQFHDIFDAHFKEAPGEFAQAKKVASILRQCGLNNERINDFKAWVERAHRVRYRPTKDGRVYLGMALHPPNRSTWGR